MTAKALMKPDIIPVNRSQLRQNQSASLRRARGKKILLVKARSEEEEKFVVDKQYFNQILKTMDSLRETLEIAMDRKLFHQILAAADTLEQDVRTGKLHSLEEVFGEG